MFEGDDLDFGVSLAKGLKIKKELEWALAHKKEFRKIWQQKVHNGKMKSKETHGTSKKRILES